MRNFGNALLLCSCLAAISAPREVEARHHHDLPVLRVPAAAHGFVGGESQDTYALALRNGQRIVVRLDWKYEGDNKAEFEVGESRGFAKLHGTVRGAFSPDGREWNGVGCHAGKLYIRVMAHPSAHYVLTIQPDPKPIPDPCKSLPPPHVGKEIALSTTRRTMA